MTKPGSRTSTSRNLTSPTEQIITTINTWSTNLYSSHPVADRLSLEEHRSLSSSLFDLASYQLSILVNPFFSQRTMFVRAASQAARSPAVRATATPMARVAAQQTRSASEHAIANPTLAGIEKRWEGMPPQEQADLFMQLRDRMKVDWHEMTLQEKKAGTYDGNELSRRPKRQRIQLTMYSLLDRIRIPRSSQRNPQR